MRYFNLALMGLLCMVFMLDMGCATEGGVLLDQEDQTSESFFVEGAISYQGELVSDARVAVLDMESMTVVDESVSDDQGYYLLSVEQTGDYSLLAGYEDVVGVLMAATELSIQEQSQLLNLELEEVVEPEMLGLGDDDMPVFSLDCWVVYHWWRFCWECCSGGWYTDCWWSWCG